MHSELTHKALLVSESRYRRLFETAQDGILLLNPETAQIEDVNPYLIDMLGYSHAELLGKKLWEVGPFADRAESKEMFAKLQTEGYVRYEDLPLRTKLGAQIAVEFVSNGYDCDGVKVIQCNIRDITERKTAEAKAQRHENLYAALVQCNRAIVHCTSEGELFKQICRAAVQFGGMKMAWIGLVDHESLMVRPVASFGDHTEYLKGINISVNADSPFGRGPTGTAIRENRLYWCPAFLNNPETAPWNEHTAFSGFVAGAALPLQRNGIVVGAFTLYFGETGIFDEAARNLLIEMVTDISFALDNFAREFRRKEVENEIKFKNAMLQTQQETSLDAILVVDEGGKIISYNRQFIDLWRLSPQLVSARIDAPVLQSVADKVKHPVAFIARVHYLDEHRLETSREEILLKDGRIIDRYSAPVTGEDHHYYGRVWYFRDVTARRKAEQMFKSLLDSAPDAMVIVNRKIKIILVNSQATNMFGWRQEELLGQNINILMPERFRSTHSKNQAFFFNQPRTRPMGSGLDLFGLHKNGTEFPIEISLSPLETDDGPLVISAIRDITERRQAESRIAFLNRVYAVLSGINSLIVRVPDRDELFREACRIAVEVGGFRMAMIGIVDQSTMKIIPTASAGKNEALVSAIKSILSSAELASCTMVARAIRDKMPIVSNDSQNDPQVVFCNEYADAGVCSISVLPLIVSNEAVGVLALYASESNFFQEEEMKLLTELVGDISFAIDHLGKQDRLAYLAYYDVLTGLANRSLFLDRVAQYMRNATRGGYKLAIALIDLERFKSINDSLGRPAGATLLRQVAEWLTYKVVDTSLLARLDADHFAVVLPEVKSDGNLAKLVENFVADFLGHPFRPNGAKLHISCKVGIALFPDDGDDTETLFTNAEVALKKSKESGDPHLFYAPKMTEAVAAKLLLENQLRQAIENEEFILYYQPKVSLENDKITGAEALIRWNNPRTGLVRPDKFIPTLEETGLISEVGRWALQTAIADYLRWRSAGLCAVRIAVNVSQRQMRNLDFLAGIEQAIAIDVRAPEGLELEITEGLIMADIKHNIASLRSIRALGVSIAIDDFGTGFSSLSYLAKLPVDTLKIDRSFVLDMTAGQEGLALVSTIISLAHSLRLKVVAEGVETEEQSRLLRLLGCDEIQGFLFSKPVPRDIFEAKFLTSPPTK